MEEVTVPTSMRIESDADLLFGSPKKQPEIIPEVQSKLSEIQKMNEEIATLEKELAQTNADYEKSKKIRFNLENNTHHEPEESDSEEITEIRPFKKQHRPRKEIEEISTVAAFKRKKRSSIVRNRHVQKHDIRDELAHVVEIRQRGDMIPNRLNRKPGIRADAFTMDRREIVSSDPDDVLETDDFELVVVQNVLKDSQQTNAANSMAEPTQVHSLEESKPVRESGEFDSMDNRTQIEPSLTLGSDSLQQAFPLLSTQQDSAVHTLPEQEMPQELPQQESTEQEMTAEEIEKEVRAEETTNIHYSSDSDDESYVSRHSPRNNQKNLSIAASVANLSGRAAEIIKMSLSEPLLSPQTATPRRDQECIFFHDSNDELQEIFDSSRVRNRVKELMQERSFDFSTIEPRKRKPLKKSRKRARSSFLSDPSGKKLAQDFSLQYKRQKLSLSSTTFGYKSKQPSSVPNPSS